MLTLTLAIILAICLATLAATFSAELCVGKTVDLALTDYDTAVYVATQRSARYITVAGFATLAFTIAATPSTTTDLAVNCKVVVGEGFSSVEWRAPFKREKHTLTEAQCDARAEEFLQQ